MLDQRIAQTFVELADTLVADFDIIDLLHTLTERAVDLLGVDAAGILLVDKRGTLKPVAASTEQVRMLELFQLQSEQGPCLDSFHSGEVVACVDLTQEPHQWPRFAAAAHERGFVSVHAVPMRLRDHVIGAMNMFRVSAGAIPAETAAVAQSLADVATIGILNMRAVEHNELLVTQLQVALNTRVLIEQAKGVLAERRDVSMEDAFTLMRDYARSHNQQLTRVARAVIKRDPDVGILFNRPQNPA
jgi:GAF domain-containing protein